MTKLVVDPDFELSDECGSTLFKQAMDIWIAPEVKRRQEAGILKVPLDLRSAQVIFSPDGMATQVRINSEVKAIAQMKLKPGISKKAGEWISSSEVDGIGHIKLTEEDNPDCGHITLVNFNNEWILYFDLRYNKASSMKHVEVAEQFYMTAKFSFNQKNWNTFADNLFSSAELAVKSLLLSTPDADFKRKTSHAMIQTKFNKFARLGNIKPEYRDTFNKLSGSRTNARYLRGDISFTEDEALKLMGVVEDLIKDAIISPMTEKTDSE
jgi:uncharacterized protein (UPF0332 family)